MRNFMDFKIYCIFLMEPEFDIKNQRPKTYIYRHFGNL